MINHYRRPRCRGPNVTPKQNQVRPISGSNSNDNINGKFDHSEEHSAIAPNAPQPNRRKLKDSSGDMQDLTDSLSIIQPSSTIQVPSLQNVQRRQRRKNILRNKSPTLSPIHESGFSNPASPQLACKHTCTGSIPSIANTGSLCGNAANIK
jgi:palmitoyltransferase